MQLSELPTELNTIKYEVCYMCKLYINKYDWNKEVNKKSMKLKPRVSKKKFSIKYTSYPDVWLLLLTEE